MTTIVLMSCNFIANKEHYERVSECPRHYSSMAICGTNPPLCDTCQNSGYYIHREGGGFFADLSVRKRD